MTKNWFITGAGRGFGRSIAESALGRGDRVAATARSANDLDDLVERFGDAVVPITLDVTDAASVQRAVHTAATALGRLDVVVNNAGYGLFGAVEELAEDQLRAQFDVNFFGVVKVTQAALPLLREQGSGHIIQISSIGGVIASASLGGYHASKWALEGISESLAQEVAGFGIAVTLVEPGGYDTDWGGKSAVHADPQQHYEALRQEMAKHLGDVEQGDPAAFGPAMLKLVDADEPPLRVFFGASPLAIASHSYQDRIATWEKWKWLSDEAQGASAP